MGFWLHVGRLPFAISRIASRNRIVCEAAFKSEPMAGLEKPGPTYNTDLMFRGIINEPLIYEAYTVTFMERPSFHSLDTYEDNSFRHKLIFKARSPLAWNNSCTCWRYSFIFPIHLCPLISPYFLPPMWFSLLVQYLPSQRLALYCFYFSDGNWRQAEAWNLLLAGAVEVNAFA